jgi:predicted dehydrogenase
MSTERVVLFGAGLIGKERAEAVGVLRGRGRPIELVGIFDPNTDLARTLADASRSKVLTSPEEAWALRPTLCMIATPHDTAVELTRDALGRGLRVLVEKPLGRSLSEAQSLAGLAGSGQLMVGCNYRFYAGIERAVKDLRDGWFGKLISVSMILGHGGSPGMEKTWKLDPVRAGGGCLIDPGIHLLDLVNVINDFKELSVVGASAWQGFWKTGIEEETHVLLRSPAGFSANLQISVVRWRSIFRLEIHGESGYGIVNGRNRSYGRQTYVRGPRWGWQNARDQAAAEELVLESDGNEVFADELDSLFFKKSATRPCSAEEALQDMCLLERCRAMIR